MNNNNPWLLVIQRVSSDSVDLWLGNLEFASNKLPLQAKIELVAEAGEKQVFEISQWQRPYTNLAQGFYARHSFNGLQASKHYSVLFSVRMPGAEEFTLVQQGYFSCLPTAVPALNDKPFTIAFGSCFSNQDDEGQLASAYAALYERGDERFRPDVTFLLGDQVYLDIGFASLIPFSPFIRKRIANRYADNWRALSGVFSRGGTWMLPDDHEYWNDYPFNDLPILALQALKIPSVRAAWVDAASDAINNIQAARSLEVINIGNDLSICLANLRSHRTRQQFMAEAEFAQLLAWAKNLTCVGVLVVQQVLMDSLQEGERNLPSFTEQYSALIAALAETGNDILVLSGDVHFGRVSSVQLGKSGASLTELVASPLSNLKGLLNGLAADVANNSPEFFPALPVSSVPSVKVNYDDTYKVGHQPGKRFSCYPKPRTHEHFMTVSFSKVSDQELAISVQAWCVRQPDAVSGLPSPGFATVYKASLKKHC